VFRLSFSQFVLFLVFLISTLSQPAWSAEDKTTFPAADALVREAVEKGDVPGAVLLIGRGNDIALRHVYGQAGLRPVERAMSENPIFDLASLTKSVATSTAVMLLLENKRLELDAPVYRYLPAFGYRQDITIRHLLTHTAGFPAGGAYAGKIRSLSQIINEIAASAPKSKPGEAFLYSDFSFITLGAVVEAVSGQRLDEFCREHVFEPLGMKDTFFHRNEATLTPEVLARIAATTGGDDLVATRGFIHDPTSRALGGVAGHAGLFSTADDLSRFCRMILGGGELDGMRFLQPETVKLWTSTQAPGLPGGRALGWDLTSPYSVRGTLSELSFGHTGFTGTSIWVDPANPTFIILLTNAVHGKPAKSVVALRRAVSTAVATELNGTGR
jgi:CubicO group peptidase (beta-lactamase class C family)